MSDNLTFLDIPHHIRFRFRLALTLDHSRVRRLTPREVLALECRNASLTILLEAGALTAFGDCCQFPQWSGGGLTLMHYPAFTPFSPGSGHWYYEAIFDGFEKEVLSHGLDIWDDALGKVLSVEWSDTGALWVKKCKPGPWIEKLKHYSLIMTKDSQPICH